MPANTAVVGQVSTHWPTRRSICFASSLPDIEKISTAMPGRPSGVSSGASSRSMPASQPQAMTEVAKPVALTAACRAQVGLCAVMSSRVAFIGKASAKVSSMTTPL
jgi:hypothetical protein